SKSSRPSLRAGAELKLDHETYGGTDLISSDLVAGRRRAASRFEPILAQSARSGNACLRLLRPAGPGCDVDEWHRPVRFPENPASLIPVAVCFERYAMIEGRSGKIENCGDLTVIHPSDRFRPDVSRVQRARRQQHAVTRLG